MSTRQTTEGLSKGLLVLRALNEKDDVSVLELHRSTGLPRPTLYRILATLVKDGYVINSGRGSNYKLTILTRSLSVGYRDEEWVSNIASPMLSELGNKIIWPVDIATFDTDSMLVRDTTHQTSPLSLDRHYSGGRGFPGYRVPVLTTALGLSFLAACSDPLQNSILEVLRDSSCKESELANNGRKVRGLIRETQKRGYGLRIGGFVPKTGSIAVPIKGSDGPIATICMHYILSAMSLDAVLKQYLKPLKTTAKKIEKQFVKEL